MKSVKSPLKPPPYPALAAAMLGLAVNRVKEHRWTVATAESLTGGLLAHLLTSIPGSSAYFDRGITAYSNQAKAELLGVPENLIAAYGAVSRECALAMAGGLRGRSGVDVALSTTGIAGPDGERPGKPIGLVWTALSTAGQEIALSRVFRGSRQQVAWQAALMALELLLKAP